MFNTWINEPKKAYDATNRIVITADKDSNLFVDPTSDFKINTAPIYATEINSDFTLSCKVLPYFENTYDAGAIILYISDTNWVKLAYESTDMGHSAVVCVVTDGYSDDSNGEVVTVTAIWMKMTKKDRVVGVYYSQDSVNWRMVRLFKHNINENDKIYLGLSAQSPLGDECKVVFEDINYVEESVEDFRKGV